MLSNWVKQFFEQQREIWSKGSSDAKVLAFFCSKRDWRDTIKRFRPLQTFAVGFKGVHVKDAYMLKFGTIGN